MNSFYLKSNNKDIIKWYEFNVKCMIKRGIKVPSINSYKDINNTIFFDIDLKDSTTLIEEGVECCTK